MTYYLCDINIIENYSEEGKVDEPKLNAILFFYK